MATTVIVPLPRSVTPRLRTPRSTRSTVYNVTQEYDPRLDDHQQTYVLSPRVMTTLTVSTDLLVKRSVWRFGSCRYSDEIDFCAHINKSDMKDPGLILKIA